MLLLEVKTLHHLQAKCAESGCTLGARYSVTDKVRRQTRLYCPRHTQSDVRKWELVRVTP